MKLNGGRTVTGILRGFDPYMNIVVDDAVEERSNDEKINIGMVVSWASTLLLSPTIMFCGVCMQVIRGNSITLIEALERIV